MLLGKMTYSGIPTSRANATFRPTARHINLLVCCRGGLRQYVFTWSSANSSQYPEATAPIYHFWSQWNTISYPKSHYASPGPRYYRSLVAKDVCQTLNILLSGYWFGQVHPCVRRGCCELGNRCLPLGSFDFISPTFCKVCWQEILEEKIKFGSCCWCMMYHEKPQLLPITVRVLWRLAEDSLTSIPRSIIVRKSLISRKMRFQGN